VSTELRQYDGRPPRFRGVSSIAAVDTGLSGLALCLFGGLCTRGQNEAADDCSIDVGEQVVPGGIPGWAASPVHGSSFQSAEVAFHWGAVPAISPPAYGLDHPDGAENLMVIGGGVLVATIGMVDQTGRPLLPLGGHGVSQKMTAICVVDKCLPFCWTNRESKYLSLPTRSLNACGRLGHDATVNRSSRLQRVLDCDAEYVTPLDMLAELRDDNKQLAAHMREHGLCDEHGDVASASLLENWIDEAERRTRPSCSRAR
jgi:hypothetical protein